MRDFWGEILVVKGGRVHERGVGVSRPGCQRGRGVTDTTINRKKIGGRRKHIGLSVADWGGHEGPDPPVGCQEEKKEKGKKVWLNM